MHTEYLETELLKALFFKAVSSEFQFSGPQMHIKSSFADQNLVWLEIVHEGIKRFDILFLYLLFPKIVNLPWRKIHLKSEGQKTEKICGFLYFTCLGCVLSKKTNIFLVNKNMFYPSYPISRQHFFTLFGVFYTFQRLKFKTNGLKYKKKF